MRNTDIEATTEAIEYWIKDQVRASGTDGVVIGLSGGVDSALTAALCARALGKERVHGMVLPCYSSEDSVVHAIEIATQLGIGWRRVTLNSMYDGFAMDLPELEQLPRANLKSRLRMCALYAWANQKNCLVCGTTNLTEMRLGYFTKYGDGGIDIEPIAMLLKCEVREMSRYVDVPRSIIEKTPSADLWTGQSDEDELGYTYDELDEAVLKMVCGEYIPFDAPGVDGFVRRSYGRTQHKREVPPQCKVLVRGKREGE